MNYNNVYTTAIQCSTLNKLSLSTCTFNVQDFADVVCCKLPDDMPREYDLSDIYCLETDSHLNYTEYVSRDEHRPWIDISRDLLDISIGQHVYKMTFTDSTDSVTISCWFSYIIQDNNPQKPYIYMNREVDDSYSEET